VLDTAGSGDGGLRAYGLAPLGDGWAVAVETREQEHALVRLDADGAPLGHPIALEQGERIGRGEIGMRPLGEGVLVRSGDGLRFFLPNGDEPYEPLVGLDALTLGEAGDDEVLAVSWDEVLRITRAETLVVERVPSGLEPDPFDGPAEYPSEHTRSVSMDGCLVAIRAGWYAGGENVRTRPVFSGARCPHASRTLDDILSIAAYGTLADGRFAAVANPLPVLPDLEQRARIYALDGPDLVRVGAFGPPVSYGVRAAIASGPDRNLVATTPREGFDGSPVSIWSSELGSVRQVTEHSEQTGVYLAWHPRLDRIAAVYGRGPAAASWEQSLGFRCDL
jgi:hypothetical protein